MITAVAKLVPLIVAWLTMLNRPLRICVLRRIETSLETSPIELSVSERDVENAIKQ